MSDLISRQAAIDALIKWYGCEPTDIGAFENIIEKLPSADAVPVVRCKDCKHRHKITCAFLIANCMKTGDDNDFCSRGERKDDE